SVRQGPMSVGPYDSTRLPEAIVPPPTVWQVSNDGGGGFNVVEHGWPAPADAAGASSSAPRIGARPTIVTLPQEISLITRPPSPVRPEDCARPVPARYAAAERNRSWPAPWLGAHEKPLSF